MKQLTAWFIRNPVAANIVMMFILLAGLLNFNNIRIEGFPKLPADTIEISVVDVGASAKEVDSLITRSIEQAMDGLPGLRHMISYSVDGQAVVELQKQENTSLDRLVEDARLQLDSITTFPSTAERPTIRRLEFSFPSLIVQIYGDVPQKELQKAALELKQRLLALPQVSEIKQWGEKQQEISIEVAPVKLKSLGLTMAELVQTVQQNSLKYRFGEIKTAGTSIQLRADHRAEFQQDFYRIPITSEETGRVITLGEIAEIKDDFKAENVHVVYQGKPTIGFEISISQKGNILEVSKAVKELLDRSQDLLSEDIKADVWADQSEFVLDRLNLLQSNAWQGLIIVFVILSIFLHPKLAFWVALGIPISVMGVFSVIGSSYLNYSLNDITTLGLIIVLGILVDDAVVVGESVYSARKNITDRFKATESGVEKVATATVFGVLTSVAALYPLTTIDSALGKLLGSFAIVVIVALLFSLFESKFILPSHLATVKSTEQTNSNIFFRALNRLRQIVDQGLNRFTRNFYIPCLKWSLANRNQVLISFVLLMVIAFLVVSKGFVRTSFFPDVPGNIISISMEMDSQIPYSLAKQNTLKIEKVANQLNREWILTHSLTEAPIKKIMIASIENTSEIYAELSPVKSRPVSALDIQKAWRERIGTLEGVLKLQISAAESTAGGFTIDLFADDLKQTEIASSVVLQELNKIVGVSDARSELQARNPEIKLQLNKRGESLGLTIQDIATEIGDSYGGLEFQRFIRGSSEVKVYARYDQHSRSSLEQLYNHQLRLDNGQWIPLMNVVNVTSHYVPQYLWRKNKQIGVSVSATIDKSEVSSREVFNRLMQSPEIKKLLSNNPRLKIAGAGELEQEADISKGLKKALLIGTLLIYCLLAVPLKSYWKPLIIISVVPFGFIGAVIGHWLLGLPLSVLSFFGMLALSGVVVNDSLVLVSRYNQDKEQGLANPIVSACESRVRAIFLTTVTTVAGLMPIIFESSEQAQYLIPAAVSLAFGEIFATLITLIIVPLLLSLFVDCKSALGHVQRRFSIAQP